MSVFYCVLISTGVLFNIFLTKFNADVKGLMVYSSLKRRAVFEISSGLARGNSLLHDFSSRSIKLFISPSL